MSDLTRDDLMTLLIEECAEVIQAATKCQRFGFSSDHGTGYGRNDKVLAAEIGDLDAIMAALLNGHLPDDAVAEYASKREAKIAKAENAKRLYGTAALLRAQDHRSREE